MVMFGRKDGISRGRDYRMKMSCILCTKEYEVTYIPNYSPRIFQKFIFNSSNQPSTPSNNESYQTKSMIIFRLNSLGNLLTGGNSLGLSANRKQEEI